MISDLKLRAVRGVGWSFVDRTATKLIALIVFIAIARILTPIDIGVVALAKSILAVVRPLLDQGTRPAIVQRDQVVPKHQDSSFWLNATAGAIFALALAALAVPIAAALGEPQLRMVLALISTQFLLEGLGATHAALLERSLQFKPLAIRSLAAEVIGGMVGLGLAVQGLGLWSLVGQAISRQAVDTMLLWLLSSWRPSIGFSLTHTRELLSYGYRAMGWRIVSMASSRVDELLVGALLGVGALGHYSVGLRIVRELRNLFTGSVGVVAFPTFARLQADKDTLLKAFYRLTEYTAVIALPTYSGLLVTSPLALPALFGPQWSPATPVVQAFSVAGIFGVLGGFSGSMLAAVGRPTWNTWRSLAHLVLMTIAIWLAAPYGLATVAFAAALAAIAGWPVGLLLVHRLIPLNPRMYLRSVVLPIIATLIMSALILAFASAWQPRVEATVFLMLEVLGGALLYAVIVLLARPHYLREMAEFVPVLAFRRG